MGLGADAGHFAPVDVTVQPDADPAPVADVRGAEEPLWLRARQLLLGSRRSGAPQVRELVVMMPVRPQHDELPPCEERRGPVAGSFLGARQGQADRADPVLDRRGFGLSLVRAHANDLRSSTRESVAAHEAGR
jgi:hypothetical protein